MHLGKGNYVSTKQENFTLRNYWVLLQVLSIDWKFKMQIGTILNQHKESDLHRYTY